MPRNRPALPDAQARAALVEQLRANAAFEHSVVAVLAGALACGGAAFALIAAAALASGPSPGAVPGVLIVAGGRALTLTLLFFLIGFAASAAVVAPLFRYLEGIRRRAPWPYAGAGAAIAGTALAATRLFAIGSPGLIAVLSVSVGAGAAIVLFARRMRAVWAAARAEEEEAASATWTLH